MATLWLGRDPSGTRASLDADALLTHGVCVGMTGSGKTGLCISLIEEVAGAGVPVIAIDPKGDLTNLALTTPDPAAAVAWRAGQAEWGVADVDAWSARVAPRIYTPGSEAGLGVDVLGALRRPSAVADDETRRELVSGVVSALLGLVGEEADPVRSPSHVVLSRILDEAWLRGEDPDLAALLSALVDPPFAKVGVFPTDRFYPPGDRMELAMRLNALLASPSFAAWSVGAALDVGALLAEGQARTPIHIFTLAHLSEPERHFFVGILLDRIAAWTRTLPGTSRLRALVFFDEVWGYLPPHPRNPASKRPMLALLKQARAVGVGAVLATQNPVDLDYKALSNAGTWFIGRLQTRNDRDRVLEGLTGAGMERSDAEGLLDGVKPRRFLLHRVGRAATYLDTRWTRVYLAGPLTRPQIRALAGGAEPPSPPVLAAPTPVTQSRPGMLPKWPGTQWYLDPAAVFAARFEGAFSPWAEAAGTATRLRPALLVRLALRFDEERAGFVEERVESRVYFPLEDALPLAPLVLPLEDGDCVANPPSNASFDAVPSWLDEAAEIEKLTRDLVSDVLSRESTGMWANPILKLNGRGGESRADFEARCRAAVDLRVDEATAALRERYARKLTTLEDKVHRLEQARARQETSVKGRQSEEWMNVGETVLGFFVGRRKSLSTLATRRRQVMEASARVDETDADLAAAREAIFALEAELEGEVVAIRAREDGALAAIEEREVRLERDDVRVLRLGLLWVPVTRRV